MPTLKDVENKIKAVKKTKQITKAMNMVAASRLRGAQANMEAFRPYAAKFGEVLGSLAEKSGEDASPLLVERETVKNIHVVLCTSDRGLCGGFNMNLIEELKRFIAGRADAETHFTFTAFGKKGRDWFRKNEREMADIHLDVVGANFGFNVASQASRKLVDNFLNGTYDEVHVVYAEFAGMGKQIPMTQQLLPILPITAETEESEAEAETTYLAEHLCEPSANELLEELLPQNISVKIHSALLETSTSEHAARMLAMDNATKACNDMIENLTLVYNKARQAAITAELMDIVGGAEALKG